MLPKENAQFPLFSWVPELDYTTSVVPKCYILRPGGWGGGKKGHLVRAED